MQGSKDTLSTKKKANIWLCTRNNPDTFPEEYLKLFFDKSKAVYVCGQLEKGLEEGTPHIQFYVNFKNPVRLSAMHKVDPKAHYEKVKFDHGADKYCMKEDTRVEGPWEFGKKPMQRNDKKDWEEILTKAKQGKFEDIPADVQVAHYGNLQRIRKDNLHFSHLPKIDPKLKRGLWIWGESGIGKSKLAREKAGEDFYPKLCNKWWDGYRGQTTVIMDDIGLDHKVLGQQLKLWTDIYAVVLETKGGAVMDNYTLFIVTSQYQISDIFPDRETCAAISRRCEVIHMDCLLQLERDV